MNFVHVLLMRFNLRYPGYAQSSDPAWLARRCDLFESRMLPSLQEQTNDNFICVPLMDREHTPDYLFDRVEEWNSSIIKPAWFGPEWAVNGVMYDHPPLWKICESAVKHPAWYLNVGDTLVTTRIDSDDALHEDFVDTIQKEVKPDTLEWLNIEYGWAEKDGLVYPDAGKRNMFISLVEPYFPDKPPLTVHRVWHKKANDLASVRQIGGWNRLWLRGIHTENKSSKLRPHNTNVLPPQDLRDLEGFIWD